MTPPVQFAPGPANTMLAQMSIARAAREVEQLMRHPDWSPKQQRTLEGWLGNLQGMVETLEALR